MASGEGSGASEARSTVVPTTAPTGRRHDRTPHHPIARTGAERAAPGGRLASAASAGKRGTCDRHDLLHRRRWLIHCVLMVALLAVGMDNTILDVALPTLGTELSAGSTALQWMIEASVLLFAALPLGGAVGDRIGRRRAPGGARRVRHRLGGREPRRYGG